MPLETKKQGSWTVEPGIRKKRRNGDELVGKVEGWITEVMRIGDIDQVSGGKRKEMEGWTCPTSREMGNGTHDRSSVTPLVGTRDRDV